MKSGGAVRVFHRKQDIEIYPNKQELSVLSLLHKKIRYSGLLGPFVIPYPDKLLDGKSDRFTVFDKS